MSNLVVSFFCELSRRLYARQWEGAAAMSLWALANISIRVVALALFLGAVFTLAWLIVFAQTGQTWPLTQ